MIYFRSSYPRRNRQCLEDHPSRMCFGRLPIMRIVKVTLIAAAATILTLNAQQADAQTGTSIDLPASARAVLQVKGVGVQIYTCADANGGLKWVLKGPDAKLLDASGKEIGSHFAGPAWRLADGSQVEGELVASMPAPQANSIPWLLLRAKSGTATGKLANVEFIRRTETHGGIAAESDCQNSGDAGKTVQISYTATYTFYAER